MDKKETCLDKYFGDALKGLETKEVIEYLKKIVTEEKDSWDTDKKKHVYESLGDLMVKYRRGYSNIDQPYQPFILTYGDPIEAAKLYEEIGLEEKARDAWELAGDQYEQLINRYWGECSNAESTVQRCVAAAECYKNAKLEEKAKSKLRSAQSFLNKMYKDYEGSTYREWAIKLACQYKTGLDQELLDDYFNKKMRY